MAFAASIRGWIGGYNRILNQIAVIFPAQAEALEEAVAATVKVKAPEAEAAFLEGCKAERERFTPYIYVDGEIAVPMASHFFWVSGGRWNLIELPKAILKLPLAEQLVRLPELMAAYRRRYDGFCPFFGRADGLQIRAVPGLLSVRRRGPSGRAYSEAVSQGDVFGGTSIAAAGKDCRVIVEIL